MTAVHVAAVATAAGPLLRGLDGDPASAALMARIAAHDQAALESFYRSTLGRVYGLAMRITRHRELAEEVTEDVYVQIWMRASSFDAMRGTALAWALTICRSRAIDALRRVDRALRDPDPADRLDAMLDPRDDLQDLLGASRRNAALHEAIGALQPQQRQLIALGFFQGLSHQELATHTGLPLGTVKSIMRRTLAQLRKELWAA